MSNKIKKHEGRRTLEEEMGNYFQTPWTIKQGQFFLDWVTNMPFDNRKLIELLKSAKTQAIFVASPNPSKTENTTKDPVNKKQQL